MASYFRSLFGSKSNKSSKSHNRSASTSAIPVQNQNLSYVYAEPAGTVPPTPVPRARERSNSNVAAQANTPSPLRYTAYDPGSLRGKRRPSSSQHNPSVDYPSYSRHHHPYAHYAPPSVHQQSPSRPGVRRSASHKAPERPSPYPLYTPTGSFSSVHSTSSSASKPPSSSGQRPTPPRTSSTGSVALSETRGEPKPVLKRDQTWSGSSTKSNRAHVSFMNPNKPSTYHMHPIMAYSRLHRPPICYDITYPPSSCTVLDRSTLNPVPSHTLTQPATEPPNYTRLMLRCDKLPWTVCVASPSAGSSTSKFYIPGSSHSRTNSVSAITTLDILFALHNTLTSRVTPSEWEALGSGSRAQRKATRAYEKRCQKQGGGWEGGIRRLDYLGRKMILVGIELDKSSNENGATGRLIFGKP
ncbi:hypothetical protein AMATHDRAFT_76830 [Amanita thiersii Skay4041]|uniref:DUF6699 domain-containing protein n=1 Tax=Amanita thiersii Skay4041 TaxID=703135 RepID=A0A2A9NJ09_9AGAR|nr:hypothetical protein AMATHDRAFT_76830 [Amanita thiersii Skay4041]